MRTRVLGASAQLKKIKNNDLVSIIPIIHGGSSKKFSFEFSKKQLDQVKELVDAGVQPHRPAGRS